VPDGNGAGLNKPVAVIGEMIVPALEICGQSVGARLSKCFVYRERVIHPLEKLLLDQPLVYAEICGHLRVVAPNTPVARKA
jgi:hypothetical protein